MPKDDRNQIRITQGRNRLIVERNSTGSAAEKPYCVKTHDRQLLETVCSKAGVDTDSIFKGTYNRMVFVDEDQVGLMLKGVATLLPAKLTSVPDSDDDDADGDGDLSEVEGEEEEDEVSEEESDEDEESVEDLG